MRTPVVRLFVVAIVTSKGATTSVHIRAADDGQHSSIKRCRARARRAAATAPW